MDGVLPMVESTAAVNKVRLSATERTDACWGSSWNQRIVRHGRKAKTKPISPGRSRKLLPVLLGAEDTGCWSVVVMVRTWAGRRLLRARNLSADSALL